VDSIEWGALSDQLASELGLPIELARHQVARLIKYDVLELV
jgi:hypothetical protein